MTIGSSPLCMSCIHYHRENVIGLVCDAFLSGIPDDIIFSTFDHHIPHEGDGGIRFEEIVQKDNPTQQESHFDTVENADIKRKMKKKKVTDPDVVDIIITGVTKR